MSANAETLPKPTGAPPKRRLRNFLLNPKFQLKYTGMVVGVTVIVASALGWQAYNYSTSMTEMLNANEMMMVLDDEAAALILDESEKADQQVLMSIIGGIAILAFALGVTGIVVTHKLVGPTYKMKRLIGEIADGHMKLSGRLRKGDELLDLYLALERMVEKLRETQQEEIDLLDAAMQKSRDAGTSEEALQDIVEVRERMAATLD
jgi:methyl-accepting chemotaxis protein